MSICSLLLESLEVFLVLRNDFRFVAEYARGLQIEDKSSKMRRCYEVLNLVITLESITVGQELVDVVHGAQSHVAAEFCDAYGVFATLGDHSLSLNF